MTRELQRDIEAIDELVRGGWSFGPEQIAAWQRIRQRLVEQGSTPTNVASPPDRERVKAHLRGRYEVIWPHLSDAAWADIADTAIKAMGETP